MKHEHSSD